METGVSHVAHTIQLYPPSDKQCDVLRPSFSFLSSTPSLFHNEPTTTIVPSRPCPPNTAHTFTSKSALAPDHVFPPLVPRRPPPQTGQEVRGPRGRLGPGGIIVFLGLRRLLLVSTMDMEGCMQL